MPGCLVGDEDVKLWPNLRVIVERAEREPVEVWIFDKLRKNGRAADSAESAMGPWG
jgi:hypothetical protein